MLRVLCILSIAAMHIDSRAFAQHSLLSGIIRDSNSHEPLIGVTIFLEGTKIGTTTNESGEFLISGLDSGSYVLQFSMIGYAEKKIEVVLASNDTIGLQVFLTPKEIESDIIVVTGTRTLRSIADVPVRIEAIPEEEIEEKSLMTPSNVAMLLNESTGMRVQTTSAAASTANLRIHGMSGRYTQILNDGIPSLGGLSAGFGLTQVVPLDLRQVEVLKGATSSLYGADAIAGVVNFLPKLPGEDFETSLLLNATTQSGFDAAGYFSERFNETGVSMLASHNRQARFDVDGDGFADIAQFERTTVTPRVLHRFSETLSARLALSFLDEHRIGGAMDEIPFAAASTPPYTETITTNRLDASSHIDWHPSDNQSFSLKLAWLNSTRDAIYGNDPFIADQKVYFCDAQLSLDLPHHNLLVGSALRIDDFQDKTPFFSSRSYRYTVPSLFVQDEIHAADAVVLVLSARLDFHNTFGTFFVPRFSLMYRPFSTMTLRLGVGTGYKAPTIFVEEAEEVGFRNVRPLANARPEQAQSLSYDVNWRTIVGDVTLDCNSALFFTTVKDALSADEDSLQTDVVFLRNSTGPMKSLGSEVSFRLTYGDFKISLGYTYVYATQEHQGRSAELELNPRHSFGVVIVWESLQKHLKVGLENYWTGSQRIERNPFRTTTPAYWVTGLIAEKGFGNFRLFVNLENIFDTRQTRYDPVFIRNAALGTIRTLPVYAPLEGRVINGGIRFVFR